MKKTDILSGKSVSSIIDEFLEKHNLTREEISYEVVEEEKNSLFGFIKKEAVVRITYDEVDEFSMIEKDIIEDSIKDMEDVLTYSNNEDSSSDIKEETSIDTEDIDVKTDSSLYEKDDLYSSDLKDDKNDYIYNHDVSHETKNVEESTCNIKSCDELLINKENSNDDTNNSDSNKDLDSDFETKEELDKKRVEAYYEVRKLLEDIFKHMGIEAKIYGNLYENNITLDVKLLDNDDIGIAIGRSGITLSSIETILRKSLSKYRTRTRLTLDINKYKKRQNEKIKELAHRLSKKVLRYKKPISLRPMNAFNRLLVHEVVSEYELLHSYSLSEEPNRYVVIELKK